MPANLPIRTPADALNASLTRIGYKGAVGSLFEGSPAAQYALNLYSQTRDALLAKADYDWAGSTVSLTLLKQAPALGYFPPTSWSAATYPPPGYTYSYGWPDDALKIRLVKPQPLFATNIDPQFYNFRIYNDNGYTPTRRTIVCNVPDAMASYTKQVTDPQQMDVAFVELLISALSRALAPVLLGLEAAAKIGGDEPAKQATAEAEQR